MGTSSFSPSNLDVLAGDTVIWRNNSQKTHNVKSETAGFDSGRFAPRGAANHEFPAAGVFPYVCTIHDGMTGQIGVYPLLLGGPARPVQPGTSVALHVRAPEGAGEVTIEADTGSGFQPVAVAGPPEGGGHEGHDEPGTLHANVVVSQTTSYRAVSAAGVEPGAARRGERRARRSRWRRRSRRGRTLINVKATPGLARHARGASAAAARALRLVAGGTGAARQTLARAASRSAATRACPCGS